jgi:acyl-CoA thioester hydrolase
MNFSSCCVTVRFRDLDALGHVNYSVYLTYLEEGFTVLWREVLGRVGIELSATEFGCVVVRTEIDYLSAAILGQELEVKVWVDSVGSSSFTTVYEVSTQGAQKVARARTVQVVTLRNRTGEPMPEGIKSALLALASGTNQ